MLKNFSITPPFFEIGPKQYLYGDKILELAEIADRASQKYGVSIIFTTPYADIRRVCEHTQSLYVFAPHMDAIAPGRGLADILPESIKAAGAAGVMLNHAERPLSYSVLKRTIERADEVGLATIVCSDSIAEAKAVAALSPNIVVAEPTELIGTGQSCGLEYISESIKAVKAVNPDAFVLPSAGISTYRDVYKVIYAGAEATGASSAIATAANMEAIVDEMIGAVRKAWDDRKAGR